MRMLVICGLLGGLGVAFYCRNWEDVLFVMFFLGFAVVALLGLFYRNPAQQYQAERSEE